MRARIGAALVTAFVAIGVVAAAWLQDVPDISADEAVTAAEDALADAGLEAVVEPGPLRTTYSSGSRAPIDVWTVSATVRSETIQLQLARAGAHPVFIDDRTPDHTSFVLSDLEYEAVVRSVDDPALVHARQRNIWLTIAGALVLGMSLAHLAIVATAKEEAR